MLTKDKSEGKKKNSSTVSLLSLFHCHTVLFSDHYFVLNNGLFDY